MTQPLRKYQEQRLAIQRQYPGPGYYQVLRWIHECLRPRTYVEIGIGEGGSVQLASEKTRVVAIDPSPGPIHRIAANIQVFRSTSDEFFTHNDLPQILGSPSFDVAFVDGLHLFENVVADFWNLEQFAEPRSVVMLHDCFPADEHMAERTQRTLLWTGDVWKILPCLRKYRSDLQIAMVPAAPTGLVIVTRFARAVPDRIDIRRTIDEFADLPWSYFVENSRRFASFLGNTQSAIRSYLRHEMDTAGKKDHVFQ
jgi:hypothetical protein